RIAPRSVRGRLRRHRRAGGDHHGARLLSLDVQALQLATYLPAEQGAEAAAEPTFFIDVARVSCGRRGIAVADLARSLRERLTVAFARLADGNLAAVQTAASGGSWTLGNTAKPGRSPQEALTVKEGMILDGFRLE